MKLTHALLLSLPLALAAATTQSDATACGGCAPPQGEDSIVTGHKMIYSVSPTETTLWDQIEYSGNPSSFAWILPIKGQVEIGLSSDALFALLSDRTRTNVVPPPLNCPPPPGCWATQFPPGGGTSGGSGGDASGGVEVIAQQVVGPYDTVQLKSTDPNALKNWLITNGYNIAPDIAPVINAYVNEGFDFLALKLIPGQGVSSMRPVRVSAPGAGTILPLRMVAAGTGPITPMTLWVFGEGRYETKNFPTFTIDPKDVVWNWDTSNSNYAALKDDAFKAGNNASFLVQYAQPTSPYDIQNTIEQLVQILPDQSGYGVPTDNWATAWDEAQADFDKLFGGINENALWLTRVNTEIARQALSKDLEVGASPTQDVVSSYVQTTKATGTPPACPTYPPCEPGTDPGGGTWWGGGFGDGNPNNNTSSGGGCAVGAGTSAGSALVVLGFGLGLSIARRRRNRKS